ncbi:MAG: glycoside hydrolase family 47 protein [Rhizomicrobium sp.]
MHRTKNSFASAGCCGRRFLLGGVAAAAGAAAFPPAAFSARERDFDWHALAQDVRAEMAWAWRNYVELAFGHDQIKPVSGGAAEFFFPTGPGLGLSMVEALDTLYLMALDSELEEAVGWITRNLHFDIYGEVQVFETNIRMVGGLLAGWLATHDKTLLALAHDLADRLLPAFVKSPTGIPYRFVNLKTGAVRDATTFPAELGTYVSEFGILGRAVGDRRYYAAAKKAAKACFDRRSPLDLVADTIDAQTGKWLSRRATVGPPSDSYYEYLYGGWRLFGDADFKHWYDVHAAAVLKHQAELTEGRLWFAQVDFETGTRLDTRQSELAAFYAGLLAKAGDLEHARAYLSSWADVQARFDVLPEGFDYRRFEATRPSNELRPEFVDSCLALFVHGAGGRVRHLARIHYQNMKATSRARFGYTVIDDVTTRPMKKGDFCPGYWWAEQMKYYWLLFSNTPRFDYRNNYLSTEGKVLVGLK